MVKLIVSDLDGTILDLNNNICQENIKAFEYINNKKIPFAICTGKTYTMCKSICSIIKPLYGIFGNGAMAVNLTTRQNYLSKRNR